jgi:hypothetical protein
MGCTLAWDDTEGELVSEEDVNTGLRALDNALVWFSYCPNCGTRLWGMGDVYMARARHLQGLADPVNPNPEKKAAYTRELETLFREVREEG